MAKWYCRRMMETIRDVSETRVGTGRHLRCLTNGEQKRACCAHCGLMMQMQLQMHPLGEHVVESVGRRLHGHIHSANQAVFVAGERFDGLLCPCVDIWFGAGGEKFAAGFWGDCRQNERSASAFSRHDPNNVHFILDGHPCPYLSPKTKRHNFCRYSGVIRKSPKKRRDGATLVAFFSQLL